VPYLRDRINRLFGESGERRILQHTSTTTTTSSTGDATEGSSFFAFASPYAYFRRIWNKLRPGRAVEVSEDVDSESASPYARLLPSPSPSPRIAFRRHCCCRVPGGAVGQPYGGHNKTHRSVGGGGGRLSQRKR
jgi:hypothetical protein